ncbi:MAG: hypothetical protein U9N84_07065 [Actinomycetota bacterium]|nr:hypothetical protein [Actinomycetota bacterium]
MKEFVVIPGDLLAGTPELAERFDESKRWIASLEPSLTSSR